MANYYNSQSLSWLVTSTWIPGMGSEWISVFYNSSLREILSHASNVVHLKKRCTARLCEVGTKGFFLSLSTKQYHNVRYKCCRCQPTGWINGSVLSLKSTWRRDKDRLYQPLHTIDARYYLACVQPPLPSKKSFPIFLRGGAAVHRLGITIKHVKMLLKIFEKSMFHLELLIYYLN